MNKPFASIKRGLEQAIQQQKGKRVGGGKLRETSALLEILARGRRQVAEGRTVPVDVAFRRLRRRKSGSDPDTG